MLHESEVYRVLQEEEQEQEQEETEAKRIGTAEGLQSSLILACTGYRLKI